METSNSEAPPPCQIDLLCERRQAWCCNSAVDTVNQSSVADGHIDVCVVLRGAKHYKTDKIQFSEVPPTLPH